jgi:hypothetical protein
MAVSQQNQTAEPLKDIIYVNCQPDSPFDKNGEKLSSIIDYTLKEISNSVTGSNAEELYEHYCNALESKLGPSRAIHKTEKLKELTKGTIIKKMKKYFQYIFNNKEKIDSLIEKAADEFVAFLACNTYSYEESYRQNKNGIVVSEFVLLKIFKSGEKLLLVPCYMAVKEKTTDYSELFLDYKHENFILYKDNTEKTINELQQENKSMEICEINQIGDLCN